ncbi:MAG: hypothetical protein VB144_02345, partial [Clostridia bacterium]|nr:hypothetical protein [Clostridia bacterium]
IKLSKKPSRDDSFEFVALLSSLVARNFKLLLSTSGSTLFGFQGTSAAHRRRQSLLYHAGLRRARGPVRKSAE